MPGLGAPPTHQLTVAAQYGAVRKSPNRSSFVEGALVALTAAPDTGYHFARWTGDVPAGRESDNPLDLTMDRDRSITAVFEINRYALSVAALNGSVQRVPDQPLYDHGAQVTLTPAAAAGYRFDKWSGDAPAGHEKDVPLVLAMDRAKSVAAEFVLDQPPPTAVKRWTLYGK